MVVFIFFSTYFKKVNTINEVQGFMIVIDGHCLTIDHVIKVCKGFEKVNLATSAERKIRESRLFVENALRDNKVVYGMTTGVGILFNTYIPPEKSEILQENIIRSHAAGVGTPFEEEVVRGIILLRANALAKGYSGVRVELINTLLELLNKKIYPYIPSQGSVGASGDLAPLAHLALVLIGEGECLVDGKRVSSLSVLKKNKIKAITLKAKEGLALINGTQVMGALACLAVYESKNLIKNAQIAGAMSLEVLKGTDKAFDKKIHMVRPHPGQMRCAENMRNLLKDSQIIKNCSKVQDAYTLRCIPQVFGAVMDTIDYVEKVVKIEINSATDNPLIFAKEDEVISGGNFHGEPLAFIMDFLGIAISEIANMSERRIDRLVDSHKSGLVPFLAKDTGLNSGFMVAQYTAAALVSENKVLAHPASVDSIPTSAGQEDYVSMGTIASRHARDILRNVGNVIAIEMLVAAQGIDFWPESPGTGTKEAHDIIRKYIPFMEKDRALYKDIEMARELVNSGKIVKTVEKVVKLK